MTISTFFLKNKYLISITLALLVVCCISLRGDKVFADVYYPPESAAFPLQVPNWLSNGSPGSLNYCNPFHHTYSQVWGAPFYLTPAAGVTSQNILVEGANYACPGGGTIDNLDITKLHVGNDPYNAFTLSGAKSMSFGNLNAGNFSAVGSVKFTVNIANLPISGCYYPEITFTATDKIGGTAYSGNGDDYIEICVQQAVPNLQCANLENSAGADLDGDTINQGTTVTLDYPFSNTGNATAIVFYALNYNYVIYSAITYPSGGISTVTWPTIQPNPTTVPAGGALNAYQTFTFSQAGTYTFHWYTQNTIGGGNGSCTTTITVVPPPPDFQCQAAPNDGLVSNPGIVVAGQSFYVTMPANNIQPFSEAIFAPDSPVNSISGYTIYDPGGVIMATGTGNPSPNPEYGAGSVTLTSSTITNPVAGTWKVNWLVSGAGGLATCTGTVTIYTVSDPYTAVWGGDVVAGSEFSTTQPGICPTTTTNPPSAVSSLNAGIVGWQSDTNIAAQAMALITGFSSNYNTASGGAYASLDFANVPNDGDFGYAPCAPSFAPPTSTPTYSPTINWAASGNQYFTGGVLDTTTQTINNGQQLTIYVKPGANVTIDGNIDYDGVTAYNSVSDIPSFTLVAQGGNINVSSGVDELAGTYVAKPVLSGTTYSSGGTIFDCTDPAGVAYPIPPPNNPFYTSCNSQLYIIGSFVARQIKFDRVYDPPLTNGSGIPNNPGDNPQVTASAEDFQYGPVVWMSTPTGTPVDNSYYDSITSLPPIL